MNYEISQRQNITCRTLKINFNGCMLCIYYVTSLENIFQPDNK